MAFFTGTVEKVFRAVNGSGGGVLPVLEKADGSGVNAQAGAGNGLVIEGVAGGTAIPVSGTVTATVDTSALATSVKQDTSKAVLDSILAKLIAAPATAALQTAANALLGTVRNATTPTKLDTNTGPLEVDDRGNAYTSMTVAHDEILVLQGPVNTALTAAQLASGPSTTLPCDGLESNTDAVYVYAQLRESARLSPITSAEWTAGAGWTFAGTIATHDGTGALDADLETVLDVVNLTVPYAIQYTISGMSAGTLTEKLGTAGAVARTADGTYMQIVIPTVDGQIHFTPSADFDGGLDITNVWVLPPHELPNAGEQKPLACSKVVAVALKSAPTAKVISPDTAIVKALYYRRQGATQS